MTTRLQRIVLALSLVILLADNSQAQPLVNIETVAVGDPGNAADSTGYGAVAYEFNIGKYEVTISQYTTFLNSVASVTSDGYLVSLWTPNMATDLNIAGISRSGSGILADPYNYSVISSGSRPIAYVSWFSAARFANWMNNGATNGASTETGAYALNGFTAGLVQFPKSADAKWWIPSEDEWYKAAYYKGGGTAAGYWIYPTQSDTAPGNSIGGATNQANYNNGVYSFTQSEDLSSTQNYLTDAGMFSNSASAYGAFDQGGNVSEWTDAVAFSVGINREPTLGGAWFADDFRLKSSSRVSLIRQMATSSTGFRLATVPEPSTYALLLITGAATLWHLRRRR